MFVKGENGAPAHATTGDPRVDLFFALVRNIPDVRLKSLVSACFDDSSTSAHTMASDLVILAFQTRDCRGGKGERDLFHLLFLEIAERFPETALNLVPLIPKYGYWKDVFVLASKATAADAKVGPALTDAIVALAVSQLKSDFEILSAAASAGVKPQGISLLGKWAPREGNKNHKTMVSKLAQALFPSSGTSAKVQYRRMVSDLNRHLGTVEVKMCEHAWGEIEATAVPSLTLMRTRKALLNEKVKGPAPTGAAEEETGNRHPEDLDRVTCRKRVREALLSTGLKKLKGKQLFPHEIVTKCTLGRRGGKNATSSLELDVFNAQWTAIRVATKEAMVAKQLEVEAAAKKAVADKASAAAAGSMADDNGAVGGQQESLNLGKLVSLVDVSGSMSGIPMEVAVALGILVSELADPAFAHRVITFHENPSWCAFDPSASIAEKVAVAKAAPWGGSTNFEAAMEMILKVCVEAKLMPNDIPDLIVFSDMQFNQAQRSRGQWETHHQRLVRRFAETGRKVCGEPWRCPEITYWNLRGDTVGFPSSAGTPGVQLLSGFSPALLKLLLAGEPLQGGGGEDVEVEVDDGRGGVVKKVVKQEKNPMEAVRKALDDVNYDAVREVLAASTEGALAEYTFTPAPPNPEEANTAAIAEPPAAEAGVCGGAASEN
jgi:Mg-chelatase subunit ChlD